MPRVHLLYLSLPLIGQVLILGLQLETILQCGLDKLPPLLSNLFICKARHLTSERYLVIPGDHLVLLVLVGINVLILLRELFLVFLALEQSFRVALLFLC